MRAINEPAEQDARPRWLGVPDANELKMCSQCGTCALEGEESCSQCGAEPDDDSTWRDERAEVARERLDAERWRALMSSPRIRFIGGARLGHPDALVGVEFYGEYPAGDEDWSEEAGRRELLRYVEQRRAAMPREPDQEIPAGCTDPESLDNSYCEGRD